MFNEEDRQVYSDWVRAPLVKKFEMVMEDYDTPSVRYRIAQRRELHEIMETAEYEIAETEKELVYFEKTGKLNCGESDDPINRTPWEGEINDYRQQVHHLTELVKKCKDGIAWVQERITEFSVIL